MNDKLNVAVQNYNVTIAICKKANELANINSKYIAEFNIPILAKNNNNTKKEIDIGALNKIKNLLADKISPNLFENFCEIVRFRDKLAHGKRFHQNVVLLNIEETKEIMTIILKEI